jgi:hypothetical protein
MPRNAFRFRVNSKDGKTNSEPGREALALLFSIINVTEMCCHLASDW